jgi:hypothetical protein
MITPPFHVSRPRHDELCIELREHLDEGTALACERELHTQAALAKDASLDVLWDLRELTGYTLEARNVLVRMQSFLGSKARRTVYVAERAEPRGLALWAVHMASHWHAHLSKDLASARAWLQGAEAADSNVKRLASMRPPAPSVRPPVSLRPTPGPMDKATG